VIDHLVPAPPLGPAVSEATQRNLTIVMGAIAAVALVIALVYFARTRRPTLLLLYLSGGLLMVFEPMVDTVGACWFPRHHSWVLFTLWGRPMPIWLGLTYFFYFGIGIGAIWMLMRRGVTRMQLWALFGLAMLGDLLLETIVLHTHGYLYYGHQPLVLAEFPLWWAPVNALIAIVPAAVIYRLEGHLIGFRQWLIVPITITASAAINAAVGWPSWVMINSDLGYLPRQLGGLASFALGVWLMSAVIAWVSPRNPDEERSTAVTARLPLERALQT
jgi:hypothetical protein